MNLYMKETRDKIIAATWKQRPQKPLREDENPMCPRCGIFVGAKYHEFYVNHCPCCGQRIDWSDDPVRKRNSIAVAYGMDGE